MTSKNFTIGYTAISGDRALAALFSSGKTFSDLWRTADNQDASIYSLTSCTEVDGKWYLYQPASASSSSSP